MATKRVLWDSRLAFILASIGSAIGLGNIWRFPYICFTNGGGAFLIPYLVALLTAGIPLMILEFSLGHKMRASAPLSFFKVHKNTEWLGWFALLVAFGIVSYYTVIMGWSFNYLFYSFKLSWGANTENFFLHKFLNLSSNPLELGSFRPFVILGLILTWIAIIASVWKGPKTVGKVVYFTVTIPWIILIIFVIRGLTLPGALEGLKYYLTPQFSALLNPKVWLAAYSQIFFTLSVGFGVMIAYASFHPEGADITNNAIIVSLANCGTSFFGGFAVFSTLGYYSHISGLAVPEVVKSGISLAFITYPTIISKLPFACSLFGVLFFLMLLTLGIDSAFSLVEAGAAGLMDKWKIKRIKVNIGFGIIAILAGLIYTTQGGLYWIDIVDYFMSNFGLVIVGLLEAIFLGYLLYKPTQGLSLKKLFSGELFHLGKLKEHANRVSEIRLGSWWDICVKIITPVVLILLLVLTIIERIRSPYEGYPRIAEFLGGWLVIGVFVIISILLSKAKGKGE